MMDRLFDQANIPLLAKMVKFGQARERVLAEDITNIDTPDYTPRDLSLDKFQGVLREQVESHQTSTPASDSAVDEALEPSDANENIMFHDRNNRSIDQLMADHSSNALMHNMMIELMRKQFADIQEALKEHAT